jgi:hypothetical protein
MQFKKQLNLADLLRQTSLKIGRSRDDDFMLRSAMEFTHLNPDN